MVVYLQAVDTMPDEFGRAASFGADNRFVGAPGFENHDAKWFVATGYGDDITRLEKIVQGPTADIAQHAYRVADAEVLGQTEYLAPHMTIPGEDILGVGIMLQDVRQGLHQDVRPLLHHHTADEQHHRIERANVDAAFNFAGIDGIVKGVGVHSVVNHMRFVVRHLIQPVNLITKLARHGDHLVGTVGRMAFMVGDSGGLTSEMPVAVTSVFGGVDRDDRSPTAALLDPHGGIRGQPVVRVDDVECAHVILDSVATVHERPAHVVDFVHEVGIQRKATAVVVDAVDQVVVRLSWSLSREDMNLMAASLKSGSQFGDVNANSTDCDGVERFPGKQSNSHSPSSSAA